MPDNKLTDNEIKKALECCVSEQYTCEQCPYQEKKHYDYDKGFEIMPNGMQYDDWSCDRWLLTDLLDLINRLQEENEMLLKAESFEYDTTKLNVYKAKVKAEAYKEFMDMLENHLENETNDEEINICYVIGLIHKCKKELVGEDK